MVKKTDFNSKITEVEGKIPSISGLATSSAFTAVENKIPDTNNLVKKQILIPKLVVIVVIPDVSSLVKKTDFDVKLKAISDRVTINKSKDLLLDNELKKLKKFDAVYFRGKEFSGTAGLQNLLVFKPMPKYLKKISRSLKVSEFRCKGIHNKVIKPPNKVLAPEMGPERRNMHLKFDGSCLKRTEKYFYFPSLIKLSIYIIYELNSNHNNFNLTLENCLFGAVKLTKNADIEKYKYTGYGIGFDSGGTLLFPDGSFGQNVIIFGAYMGSSVHANNKVNNILVLAKDFIQGINGTTIYAEKTYSINFTKSRARCCLSLHCNDDNSYQFVNGIAICKFKAKKYEIKDGQTEI